MRIYSATIDEKEVKEPFFKLERDDDGSGDINLVVVDRNGGHRVLLLNISDGSFRTINDANKELEKANFDIAHWDFDEYGAIDVE